MKTKQKGDIAEALALYRLMQQGYSVANPWGDNDRYDFLIEKAGYTYRVQVKYGRYDEETGTAEANTASVNARTQEKEDYAGDADLIAVAVPEKDHVSLFTVSEAPKSGIRIRFEEPEKSSPNINWAEDSKIGG